jgi:PAS domain S-box-containing protein
MAKTEDTYQTREQLEQALEEAQYQLDEANETIQAIRTGQVDALVVQSTNGHQLFTLKSADQTYRVFIEQMTEGAVTLNRAGLILYCNSQFATMVQMPHSSVIGKAFEEFVSPSHITQYQELFAKCWGIDCKSEIPLAAGDSELPVQLSLTTLELDEGVSLSIILTDLTAQKEIEAQLKKGNEQLRQINEALESSNHDLQQFASVASHDLQEPLRKIQIFSSLLQEKESELKPESQKYLSKIIDSSRRMKTLISDILNYSKLSAAHHQIACIDLKELVTELLEDFELIIQDKQAEVTIGDLPCVEVNRGQIRQVFQNIISNALKFSKRGQSPKINISSHLIGEKNFDSASQPDGPYCLISIRDNGIGFDEQFLSNIFTLFERLNSKDQYEGTGIGLAIAKKIIDKHGGLITARSIQGEGAEFKIILPMLQGHL